MKDSVEQLNQIIEAFNHENELSALKEPLTERDILGFKKVLYQLKNQNPSTQWESLEEDLKTLDVQVNESFIQILNVDSSTRRQENRASLQRQLSSIK